MLNYIFTDKIIDDILDEYLIYIKEKGKKDYDEEFLKLIEKYLLSYKKLNTDELKIVYEIITIYIYCYSFSIFNIDESKINNNILLNFKSDMLKIKRIYNNIKSDKLSLEENNILNTIKNNNTYLHKTGNLYDHNLLKLIIIYTIHKGELRIKLYNIYKPIELTFQNIEILELAYKKIQYNTVENMLKNDNENIDRGLVDEVYNLLKTQNEYKLTNMKKILYLLEHKLIIPIIDDYIIIHDNSFSYSKYITNKNTTRGDIMTTINNKMSTYRDNLSKEDKKEITEYIDDITQLSILTNVYEEVKIKNIIEKKLSDKKIQINSIYNPLLKIINNTYQNFLNFPNGQGINLYVNKLKKCLRYEPLKYYESTSSSDKIKHINYRVVPKNNIIKMVGIAFGDILNSSNYNKINIDKIDKYIENIFKSKKIYYYFFSDIHEKNIESESKMNIENNIINNLIHIYDILHYNLEKDLLKILNINEKLTIGYYNNIIKQLEKKYFVVNTYNKEFLTIHNNIYNNNILEIENIIDTSENIINLKNIKLKPIIKYNNYICEHFILKEMINKEKYSKIIYSNLIFELFNRFIEINSDGTNILNHICKSCGNIINIPIYAQEGSYDSNGNFVVYKSYLHVNIYEENRYKNKESLIDYIDKNIDIISNMLNLTLYVGLDKFYNRNNKTREIIDLISLNNNKIKYYYNLIKLEKKSLNKKIHDKTELNNRLMKIDKKYLSQFANNKGLTLSTFSFINEMYIDITIVNTNNIICYIMVLLILDISKEDIEQLSQTNSFNLYTFKKYKNELFTNLYLSNKNLVEIEVFQYILYIISGTLLKNNYWIGENPKKNISLNNQKIIIHTIIDILNNLIELNDNIIDMLYSNVKENNEYLIYTKQNIKILKTKLYYNINNIYSNKKIFKNIHIKIKNKKEIKKYISPIIYTYDEYLNINIIPIQKKLFSNIINFIKYKYNLKPNRLSIKRICQDTGKFHIWDTNMICKLCNLSLTEIKKLKWNDKYQKIYENNYVQEIQLVYKSLEFKNINQFIYDLDKLIINKNYIYELYNFNYDYTNKLLEYNIETYINNLLIDINNELNNIQKMNINIYNDKYILNHNQYGSLINEHILFDNYIIGTKTDNEFYGVDTIYIISNNINFYYNKNNYIYLGFKSNKYVLYNKTNIFKLEKKKSLKLILQDLNEISNIKQFILYFIILLWNIKNIKFSIGTSNRNEMHKLNPLIMKYKKIFMNININNTFDNIDKLFSKNNTVYILFFIIEINSLILQNIKYKSNIYDLLYNYIINYDTQINKKFTNDENFLINLKDNDYMYKDDIYSKLMENSNIMFNNRNDNNDNIIDDEIPINIIDDDNNIENGYDLYDNDNDTENDTIDL